MKDSKSCDESYDYITKSSFEGLSLKRRSTLRKNDETSRSIPLSRIDNSDDFSKITDYSAESFENISSSMNNKSRIEPSKASKLRSNESLSSDSDYEKINKCSILDSKSSDEFVKIDKNLREHDESSENIQFLTITEQNNNSISTNDLSLDSLPKISAPIKSKTVKLNENVTFICEYVSSSNVKKVNWFHNEKIICFEHNEKKYRIEHAVNRSLIDIYKTENEDEGEYTCQIENNSGYTKYNVQLIIDRSKF